jgi:predicted DNA-binding protein
MRETMVRTQVYLPRAMYQRLQKRAAENDLTLAVQIREAVEDYLQHAAAEDEEVLMPADDPLRALVGSIATGLGDGAINHDKYIYRRDWGEPTKTQKPVTTAMKERPAKYPAKTSTKRRRAK